MYVCNMMSGNFVEIVSFLLMLVGGVKGITRED